MVYNSKIFPPFNPRQLFCKFSKTTRFKLKKEKIA